MLCVFAFSITPKQWLHDIVFNHKDTYTICNDGNPTAHLHKAGIHCDFDNLVVRSPFVDDGNTIDLIIPKLFSLQQVSRVDNINSSQLFFFSLRGPPVIA
ncbi:MAG: hypothetical protein ACHQEB_06485 [Chitinophagales bacterium]